MPPFTGYPSGSPQAPQSAMPGGALTMYQQGTAAPVVLPNLDGAGQQAQGNPGMFQNLLNMLGGAASFPGVKQAVKYGPGGLVTAGQLAQGDVGGTIGAGVGTAVGTAVAGKALQGIAGRIPLGPGLPSMLLKGGLYAGGSLLGSSLGAQLGKGVGAIGNQLVGGAQAAVGDVTNAIAGNQREQGQSAFSGREVGLGGASQTELDRQTALLKQLGVNIPNEYLTQNYQILQKYKDADVGRQMQLNQQNAQLTGALNRQMAAYQIGSQALGESSATTRQILGSNPYAASVLNTGNVRGI